MAPRLYRMDKRAESVEETRRRIVEATVRLHGEKGVLDTTIADIASRADVAVGTVYRHFPRVEDLVFACGQVISQLASPPQESSLPSLGSIETRVEALIRAYCETYERFLDLGMDHAAVRYEASKMPPLADWFSGWDGRHRALVREALGALAEDHRAVSTLLMLSGWGSWRALTAEGMSSAQAAALLSDLALRWLRRDLEGDASELMDPRLQT